ncbi:hypothetical protein LX32DRAFT_636121 [Colletotrichum zoysiae]|uniref:Uncharacterized protein n=1 Tax=Colletotrichum zoysiae TaxID=1216348 RepID=A0AAD9HQH8_9PEZI|nr:hypothetical protein LX32DRAFT_636121 [Colletotrichum zoysiae]
MPWLCVCTTYVCWLHLRPACHHCRHYHNHRPSGRLGRGGRGRHYTVPQTHTHTHTHTHTRSCTGSDTASGAASCENPAGQRPSPSSGVP